jgi:hypothetical protein
MPGTVSFDKLENADLTVEAIYFGGVQKNMGDDPLATVICGAVSCDRGQPTASSSSR